ncbi:translation factor Guf1, mitochondrial-like [Tubulanus polymorphus]|uniref:translation factor Guf1, mitochondrial-like n=1 Tax=Tubulanus polymorphus TaxID=672921 RepID=UPI003DA62D9D
MSRLRGSLMHSTLISRFNLGVVRSSSQNCGFHVNWFKVGRRLSSSSSHEYILRKKETLDISEFPVERIRNFSIIAHVDHGKSTLADRLLELGGTISKSTKNEQVLDKLQVERDRGITVKAQTASVIYTYKNQRYLLNLIDTPGHVDFSYEVSRSLAACQGVILLVDANQGVQAQTVANFYLSFGADLTIIPVLNKIDLKGAQPDVVAGQMKQLFDVQPEEIIKVSAKNGTGVEPLFKEIIERIPPPDSNPNEDFKALLFDSWFNRYRGAYVNLAIKNGSVKKGDKIVSVQSKKVYEVQEVGILYPNEVPTKALYAGQVGYLVGNMRTPQEAQIGDTLHHQDKPVEPFPGFRPATPMVFAGVYPGDQSEYPALKKAISKLILNDSSVSVNNDYSPALGQGWRLGFLGLLHMDVFGQRLEQEYNANIIMSSPNVPYKVTIKGAKNIKFYGKSELTILNPTHLPDRDIIVKYREPMVRGTIISPVEYNGSIMALCQERRGDILKQEYIDDTRLMYTVSFPLNEIIIDFFDALKSVTSGYASFDYEDDGYKDSDLVKVNLLLNGKEIEELTSIVHVSKAKEFGKSICAKLKDSIPRQLFLIAIQATVNTKVIAREDVRPLKKDVTAKLYGGDVTRRMKLLKRQSEGKSRMRKIGNIDVPKDAFIKVLKRT